jgi:3-hydroxyisobutyrate dehydrogenase-like beta-hydroxyacid dehydrogenase
VDSEPVGVIGVGDMGLPMTRHLVAGGHTVLAYDLDAQRLGAAVAAGARAATGTADLVRRAGVVVAVLRTDAQMAAVAGELAASGRPGLLLVVAGTHSLALMDQVASVVEPRGLSVIDAPVVYGTTGAREGTLLSLCGGTEEDVERARPVLLAYSRDVEHVGPLGSGQLAKACNNLLHWVHSVANFECLALAKRYGVDAQRMREVLQKCPADNGTLRRWDGSRFTWQEKDMDLVTDLAQAGGLMLPLTGQVDQLIKTMTAEDVAALLYGPECTYLGQRVVPMDLPSQRGTVRR